MCNSRELVDAPSIRKERKKEKFKVIGTAIKVDFLSKKGIFKGIVHHKE